MLQSRRARRCLKKESMWGVFLLRTLRTVDKRVQDGHGTVGDTSIGVDLFENCSIKVSGKVDTTSGARDAM